MAHILLKKHLDFLSTNTKERVWIFLTKKDRGFSVGLGERVGCILFRVDDESSINSCPEPRTVCMPPECAFLAIDGEPIGVAPPGPDRTLSYELRAICPRSPHLSHSMPDHREHSHNRTHQTSTHLNMNVHKFLNIYVYVYVHMCMYQWIVTLYLARFTTLTTRLSPFLTLMVGPGNIPFTVMILWVLQSLFTRVCWTWIQSNP